MVVLIMDVGNPIGIGNLHYTPILVIGIGLYASIPHLHLSQEIPFIAVAYSTANTVLHGG